MSITEQKKLAIIFPGIGYTVDKPLLYYSAKLAKNAGYEIKTLPYTGFPKKILGNKAMMVESFNIAYRQAKEMLSDIDISRYDEILFIGKSIGTAVALKVAAEIETELQANDSSEATLDAGRNKIRKILYTPVAETFDVPAGDAIVFTGTGDPWVGCENAIIPKLCEGNGIPCYVYEKANHSLETGDWRVDMKNLEDILEKTEAYIKIQ